MATRSRCDVWTQCRRACGHGDPQTKVAQANSEPIQFSSVQLLANEIQYRPGPQCRGTLLVGTGAHVVIATSSHAGQCNTSQFNDVSWYCNSTRFSSRLGCSPNVFQYPHTEGFHIISVATHGRTSGSLPGMASMRPGCCGTIAQSDGGVDCEHPKGCLIHSSTQFLFSQVGSTQFRRHGFCRSSFRSCDASIFPCVRIAGNRCV